MHDLVIENCRIVDGTGRPAHAGDVAVAAGRVVAVGRVNGEAAQRRINGQGLTMAPGFIDPHTHYDAQVSWDRLLRHTGALPGRVLRAV